MNLRLHALALTIFTTFTVFTNFPPTRLGTYDIHDIHGIHDFSPYTPWPLQYSQISGFSQIQGLLRPSPPATVMPSIKTEPHWREPRTTRSDPIAAMLRYISLRLPATVIS